MFHRYTEKARRAIFFARYEASQFDSPRIETEFLLLGVFREDKALANRFLPSHTRLEDLRHAIALRYEPGPKITTTLDLPLTHECKRALAYASEESERMNHQYVGTAHLLLGMLREEKSFAAHLLHEQGVTLELVREHVHCSEPSLAPGRSASIAGVSQWLAEREAHGSGWTVRQERLENGATHIALYDEAMAPDERLVEIQQRLDLTIEAIEPAIANHEFEKARLLSHEERKERENLRLLREQFNLKEPPPRTPRLCIDIIRDDLFSEIGKRCEDYIAAGVDEVWILDPNLKRAYTVTKTEGLRECKGESLRIATPPLEMNLREIFD